MVDTHSPLSRSVVAWGARTQVAPICVGAAKIAGVLGAGALVDVLASAVGLLVVEAGGAEAAEASQGVVAGGISAHLAVLALILIWPRRESEHQWAENARQPDPRSKRHLSLRRRDTREGPDTQPWGGLGVSSLKKLLLWYAAPYIKV